MNIQFKEINKISFRDAEAEIQLNRSLAAQAAKEKAAVEAAKGFVGPMIFYGHYGQKNHDLVLKALEKINRIKVRQGWQYCYCGGPLVESTPGGFYVSCPCCGAGYEAFLGSVAWSPVLPEAVQAALLSD